MVLKSQTLCDEVGIRTGVLSGGDVSTVLNRGNTLGVHIEVDHNHDGGRWIDIGPNFYGFDGWA